MEIKEILYQTPEITEEKLLEIINQYIPIMRQNTKDRISELHPNTTLNQAFLDEYDLIENKKSKLTKSQRDQVTGFVGMCMIQMVKDNEKS